MRRRRQRVVIGLAGALAMSACATLQQIAALRQVDFAIDRVSSAELAGVSLQRLQQYQDLSAAEVARIGLALAQREMPFEFNLHVSALNPADNSVTARLLQLDWTLLLDDRETIAGRTQREIQLPPGVVQDIPIAIQLDLFDFFQRNAREFYELARAVAGVDGEPKRVALRATPTIETAIGPIRYPEPITIVSEEIGGGAGTGTGMGAGTGTGMCKKGDVGDDGDGGEWERAAGCMIAR